MATLSMLLLILGAGGILLGLAWCAMEGIHSVNIKPALFGLVMFGAGFLVPLGDEHTYASPEEPPMGDPPPGPPPGAHGPIPYPSNGAQTPSAVRALNLSTEPSITTRLRFACTTDTDGAGSCWGEPVPVPEGAVHKIVLGREHGCALMQTGALSCWGEAQLEAGRLASHRFVDIAATLETICGITVQGALHCFGADMGMPPPGQRWAALSGGAKHLCALSTQGAALCWGDNTEGQASAPEDQRFTQISAGHFHSCGINMEGNVSCWGRNQEGQSSPPDGAFTQVSAGWAHSCALDEAGLASCWGCGGRHRHLVAGAEEACQPPREPLRAISAGDLWRSCGVSDAGEAMCWGGLVRIGGPS